MYEIKNCHIAIFTCSTIWDRGKCSWCSPEIVCDTLILVGILLFLVLCVLLWRNIWSTFSFWEWIYNYRMLDVILLCFIFKIGRDFYSNQFPLKWDETVYHFLGPYFLKFFLFFSSFFFLLFSPYFRSKSNNSLPLSFIHFLRFCLFLLSGFNLATRHGFAVFSLKQNIIHLTHETQQFIASENASLQTHSTLVTLYLGFLMPEALTPWIWAFFISCFTKSINILCGY